MARWLLRAAGLLALLFFAVLGTISTLPDLIALAVAPYLEDLEAQGVELHAADADLQWELGDLRLSLPQVRLVAMDRALRVEVRDASARVDQQRSFFANELRVVDLDVGALVVDVDLDLWPVPEEPFDYDRLLRTIDRLLEAVYLDHARIKDTRVRLLRGGRATMELDLEQLTMIRGLGEVSAEVAGTLDGRPLRLQWNWTWDGGAWLQARLAPADYAGVLPASAGLDSLASGLDLQVQWEETPLLVQGWRAALPDRLRLELADLEVGSSRAGWGLRGQDTLLLALQRDGQGGYRGGLLPWELVLGRPGSEAGLVLNRSPEVALAVDPQLDRIQIGVGSLQVQPWLRTITGLEVLPEVAQRYLVGMDPQVLLEDLVVQLQLSQPGVFTGVTARIAAGQARPIPSTLPGVQGAGGYIWVGPRGQGLLALDTEMLALHLEGFFRTPWELAQVSANLRWWVDGSGFYLSVTDAKGMLQFDGVTDPDGKGVAGRVLVEIPFAKGFPQRLEAQVRALDVPVKQAWRFAPTLPSTQGISEYLEEALLQGRARDVDLSVSANLTQPTGFSMHLRAQGHDLAVQYAPDWPRIEGGMGQLEVLDTSVRVQASAGTIAGVQAERAFVQVDPDPRRPGWTRVELTGSFGSDSLGDGLRFLRESPLREILGETLMLAHASGRWRGATQNALITVPPPGYQTGPREEIFFGEVDIELLQAFLGWEEWSLQLDDLEGLVTYDSDGPLRSQALRGKRAGLPLTAELGGVGAPGDPKGHGRVRALGSSSVADLRGWLDEWAQFGEGVADFRADLHIPWRDDRPVVMTMDTDLSGVALFMPAPFSKSPAETLPTEVVLSFPPAENPDQDTHMWLQTAQYCADLDLGEHDLGGLVLLEDGSRCDRQRPKNPFPSKGRRGIEMRGHAEVLQFEETLAFSQRVAQVAEADESSTGLRYAKVSTDYLRALGDTLQDVKLEAWEREKGLDIKVESARASGEIWVPDADDEPVEANMERLFLREISEDNSEVFDPVGFGLLRLVVQDLRWKDGMLGRWTISTHPVPNGMEVTIDEGRTPKGSELDVSYRHGGKSHPFRILWLQEADGAFTSMRGGMSIPTMAWFSEHLDLGPMEIKSGTFDMEMSWKGPPTKPDLGSLRGHTRAHLQGVDMDFEELEASAAIPWISQVLNVQALLINSLQLDFSADLFDEIWVEAKVDEGVVEFDRLDAVGGIDIDMSGNFRLGTEERNAAMDLQGFAVARLDKLLSAGAFLTGGPVSWLGYYLINSLLGNPLKQILTYNISIQGLLAEPAVLVSRTGEEGGAPSDVEVEVTGLRRYPCSAQQQHGGAAEEDGETSDISDRCDYYGSGDRSVHSEPRQ